ncbi:thioesterase family protein [Corynebacterium lubricantis]|uniref:thioesterase family protein n=1 Tax=Corynebacterium lubricantis TaxID=541095 RepID=UPI00036F18DE|nr:thioesterase family protein [Corynebacterium lubricantis]
MTNIDFAYFVPQGSFQKDGSTHYEFAPTEHTASPWGTTLQHGAPPAALLTHALELEAANAGLIHGRFSRVTTEILSAVPLTPLTATARVVRPGKRISLLEAVVHDPATGRDVIKGSAWWLHTQELPELRRELAPKIPAPADTKRDDVFFNRWSGAYIDTIEVRRAMIPRPDISSRTPVPGFEGALSEVWEAGAFYWVKTDASVIAGQPDTPWLQVAKIVDSANGLGTGLSPEQWSFMNVDTSIYLNRLPVGEWIGILPDANYGPDGIGVTISRIYDEHGPIGTTNQSILIAAN